MILEVIIQKEKAHVVPCIGGQIVLIVAVIKPTLFQTTFAKPDQLYFVQI